MNIEICKGVIAWVNRELGTKLVFRAANVSYNETILCLDERRRRVAIVCYNSQVRPIVRSVLRERCAGKGMGWLPNGQAGRNAIELAHWDEDHRYEPTPNELVAAYDESYGDIWVEMVRAGTIRIPGNITIDSLLSAKKSMDEAKSEQLQTA